MIPGPDVSEEAEIRFDAERGHEAAGVEAGKRGIKVDAAMRTTNPTIFAAGDCADSGLNLTPVSAYLGKPGNPDQGGLPMAEYPRRQDQFRQAEINALLDTGYFIDRAQALYDYPHFICDTGGSICEWVDPEDPADPVLSALSERTLMIWIQGSEAQTQELIRRFNRAPKPMAYQPAFLARCWQEYLEVEGCCEGEVNPDAFIRWTYGRALAHRQPLYAAMARNWGVTVTADEIAQVRDQADFTDLIAGAITRSARRS